MEYFIVGAVIAAIAFFVVRKKKSGGKFEKPSRNQDPR